MGKFFPSMDEELLPGQTAFNIIRELTPTILFNFQLNTNEKIAKMISVAQNYTIAMLFAYLQLGFLEKLHCTDSQVQHMFRNLQETVREV